jgi:hypothetical protein
MVRGGLEGSIRGGGGGGGVPSSGVSCAGGDVGGEELLDRGYLDGRELKVLRVCCSTATKELPLIANISCTRKIVAKGSYMQRREIPRMNLLSHFHRVERCRVYLDFLSAPLWKGSVSREQSLREAV